MTIALGGLINKQINVTYYNSAKYYLVKLCMHILVFALHLNRMDFHFDLKTIALFSNRVGVVKKKIV